MSPARRRLVLALVLANLAMAWQRAPAPETPGNTGAGAVRRLRAQAQARALAAGQRTYTFDTTWSPPLAAHH